MNQTEIKRFLNFLIKLCLATLAICAVILLFFRTKTLAAGISYLGGLLTPFFYGIAIAYILHPLCIRLERFLKWLFQKVTKRQPNGVIRIIAILFSLGLALALIILLIVLVIPELISSISSIISQLNGWVNQFQNWLNTLDQGDASHEAVTYVNQIITTLTDKLQSYLETSLLPNMKSMISEVTSSFLGLIEVIKNFGLGCIVAAYLLGSWEKFKAQGKMVIYGLLPRKAADWVRDEIRYIDLVFGSFIIGEILDSTLVGLVCFAFCSITNMPNTLLISLIVGVTNLIPFFGPYLGAIPSALLILMVSPYKCVVFLIFILIMQQIDGNIVAPKILGSQTGLSGLWVLFAILIFGSMWGIIGMLIGVPVFAVFYDLFRRLVLWGLKKQKQGHIIDEYQEQFVKTKEHKSKKTSAES